MDASHECGGGGGCRWWSLSGGRSNTCLPPTFRSAPPLPKTEAERNREADGSPGSPACSDRRSRNKTSSSLEPYVKRSTIDCRVNIASLINMVLLLFPSTFTYTPLLWYNPAFRMCLCVCPCVRVCACVCGRECLMCMVGVWVCVHVYVACLIYG